MLLLITAAKAKGKGWQYNDGFNTLSLELKIKQRAPILLTMKVKGTNGASRVVLQTFIRVESDLDTS
jgi:hypothetical protein